MKWLFVSLLLANPLNPFPSRPVLTLAELSAFNWVEFPKSSTERSAPIASRVRVNGNFVRDPLSLFEEKLLVSLPRDQAIHVAHGKWQFPVGTRFGHEIYFRDDQKTLFEFRILEKLNDGRWGFGAYRKVEPDRLELFQSPESAILKFELSIASEKSEVELNTIPQRVCANCHMRAALEKESSTGPCDFHPLNTNINQAWAESFKARNGWEPFRYEP